MVKNTGLDRTLLVVSLGLITMGLLMVYSTSMIVARENYGDSLYLFKRQLIWLVLGLIVFFVISQLRYPLYLNQKFVYLFLGFSLVALLLVFFFEKINNTNRWIRLAGLSLQPSELAKIAVVVYLAYACNRRNADINQFKNLALMMLPLLVLEGLILREPDFGNFVLIGLITLIMLFIAGLRLKYFVFFFLVLILVTYLLVKLDPSRMERIVSFLNPEAHASKSAFQGLQSVYALGSGGLFGQGIGNSTQKLFFLPYAYTDFIFAIVGEEFGLIGTFFIVALFILYFIRGVVIARHSDNPHTYILVMGLTMLIVTQALINISVTIGLFPTKGIPLPFISTGGTSLLSSLLVTAIILNISKHRKGMFAND